MKIRRMMTAVGIGIALLATLATPASAHDVEIRYQFNRAWVYSHNEIHVDNGSCNGNSAFVQYYVSTVGGSVLYELYDHTCQNLGTYRDHYPQQVTRFRLCETNVGCSAWKYT